MTSQFIPGTVKPEHKYERLEELSAQLGLPAIMCHLGISVADADGNIIHASSDRSRTWTRNLWNFIYSLWCGGGNTDNTNFGDGYPSLKGESATLSWNGLRGFGTYGGSGYGYALLRWTGATGEYNIGVCVGLGSTAESFNGYALATNCFHGTGTNQLIYGTEAYTSTSYNSGTKRWTGTHSRTFTNGSAESITVTESAIKSYVAYSPNNSTGIMIARDLWATPVTVPVGGVLTVTYSPYVVFPA